MSFERNLAWNKLIGCSMNHNQFTYEGIDEGIAELVKLFRDNGFWTVQSCAGTISGDLHCCVYPYVAMLPDVDRDEYHTLYRLRKFLDDNGFDFYTVKFNVMSMKDLDSFYEKSRKISKEMRFRWPNDHIPYIEVEFALPWKECRK
jgi:hypothetical protein